MVPPLRYAATAGDLLEEMDLCGIGVQWYDSRYMIMLQPLCLQLVPLLAGCDADPSLPGGRYLWALARYLVRCRTSTQSSLGK